jgi:hypothetical protein
MTDGLILRPNAADEIVDPLTAAYSAERVNYVTGVMLQADDFLAEQTYHRGRLAQLMRHMLGFGTLAGLRVAAPPRDRKLLEIQVEPGVAIDRYGRLIEVQAPYCIEVARWFAAQPMSTLRTATHLAPRTPLDKAVVADIFLSAHPCGRGKTPSFAAGPFDALDALVASRLAETPKLELVLRSEGNPDPERPASAPPQPSNIPNPTNFWPKPSGTAAAVAAAQIEAVLGCWDVGTSDSLDDSLSPLVEHVYGRETSAVLLARVAIPVTIETNSENVVLTRLDTTKKIIVDNSIRPIIFVPGKWFGRALAKPPTV